MVCKMWTLEEENRLREIFPTHSKNELEEEFNRGYNSIRQKALKLGIKKESNIRNGFCICKKCKRELPWQPEYFPKLRNEKNLRQVCRECNPKYGSFLKEFRQRGYWTEELEKKFIEIYPYYMNEEILKMEEFFQFKTKGLSDKAYTLGLKKSEKTLKRARKVISEKLTGRKHFVSVATKAKLSETWKKKYLNGYVSPSKGIKRSEETRRKISAIRKAEGKWKGKLNPRHENPLNGEENGRWEGGITSVYFMLRSNITEKKKKSMEKCNYKCVITGENFDEIHHLTPFNKIVDVALNSLGMERRKVKEYSKEEINNLVNLVKKLHNQELGVCLTKKVHKEFHDLYGYKNPTKEDFEEFKRNYYTNK